MSSDQNSKSEAVDARVVAERHARLKQLRAPFPPEKICRKPKGGVMLDYVGHADITERLLEVDPEWDWQPCRWQDGAPSFDRNKEGKPVGLWIRLTVCGVTRLGYGSVESNVFDAEKQLIGDALRNAAMRFGMALDLWSKSEAASASAPPPVRSQRVETQVRPAMRQEPVQEAASEETVMPFDGGSSDNQQDESGVFVDRLVAQFGGEEVQLPVYGRVINGVNITVPGDEKWAFMQTLPFGKHKGTTLRAVASNSQGGGYLRWLAAKICEQAGQGKAPSEVEQAVLIALDYLQKGGG
jgi:hypothetical protein